MIFTIEVVYRKPLEFPSKFNQMAEFNLKWFLKIKSENDMNAKM